MAQFFQIHIDNPQRRLITQAVKIIQAGGVVAYPTDSSYALGCQMSNTEAQERIRRIRSVGDEKHFTLMCRNLSEISHYAMIDNAQFRLLKAHTPGGYTFILKASKDVPRRLKMPKKLTIGLRVPDHAVVLALLEEMNEPLLSMSLLIGEESLNNAWQIRERLENQVDLVIDAGLCEARPTTVVDLSGDVAVLVRQGRGDVSRLGLTR